LNKLDRLARSLPDTRDIVAELTAREVKLTLGGSVHDPTIQSGRLLFNAVAMGRRVRLGLDQDEDSGGHEGRLRQRPAAWQAAQAQRAPGSPPGGTARGGRVAGTPSANSRSCSSITRSTMYWALARAHTRAAATEAASPAAGPPGRSRCAGHPPGPRGYPPQPRGRIRASTSPIGILTSRTAARSRNAHNSQVRGLSLARTPLSSSSATTSKAPPVSTSEVMPARVPAMTAPFPRFQAVNCTATVRRDGTRGRAAPDRRPAPPAPPRRRGRGRRRPRRRARTARVR